MPDDESNFLPYLNDLSATHHDDNLEHHDDFESHPDDHDDDSHAFTMTPT